MGKSSSTSGSYRSEDEDSIKKHIDRALRQTEVCLKVPPGAEIGRFIGKGGAEIKKLQEGLNDFVKDSPGAGDADSDEPTTWIFLEGRDPTTQQWSCKVATKERICIALSEHKKPLQQSIVDQVRAALIKKCRLPANAAELCE
mmetsp:Transcript_100315/g.288218  ORF Transcript_100315/g.288218 Transcript_100315/m.288218 type:complete len:143 (+) Transcript_100315:164-592(+)